LYLANQKKDQNKKTNFAPAYVGKERIQRLKRNFLPFWMRDLEGQEPRQGEILPKRNQANIEPK
jgi:hypothetical protein